MISAQQAAAVDDADGILGSSMVIAGSGSRLFLARISLQTDNTQLAHNAKQAL